MISLSVSLLVRLHAALLVPNALLPAAAIADLERLLHWQRSDQQSAEHRQRRKRVMLAVERSTGS